MPKHKQKLVQLRCGVRAEIDVKLADTIGFLNSQGIDTRFSCQGAKQNNFRGYIAMFATPVAREMAYHLLEHHNDMDLTVELRIHPHGYENLTIRFFKKDIPELTLNMRQFFKIYREMVKSNE